MNGKTIIAMAIAVLMLSSIVSAGTFLSLGNIFYNKMASQNTALSDSKTDAQGESTTNQDSNQQGQTGIQTITNTGQTSTGQNSPGAACTSQNECLNGNCVCRCAQMPVPAAASTTATPASEMPSAGAPAKPLALQGLKLATGKAITIPGLKTATGTLKLPSAGSSNKLANGAACTANAQCSSGICSSGKCVAQQANAGNRQTAPSSGSGSSTGTAACNACLARCRVACTQTGQQTPPPQTGDSSGTTKKPNGQACSAAADCESGNCANMVTTGSVSRGICAANVASSSSSLSSPSGLRIKLPLTGKAITLPGIKTSTGILKSTSGNSAETPVLPSNGAVCTSNTQCSSGICSAGKCAAQTLRTEGQSCSANLPCATGLSCLSGRCAMQTAPQLRANGIACANNAQCSSGYCLRKVCADRPAGQTPPLTCEERCVETCSPECRGQGQETPPPSAGTKKVGETCSSSTGCETECETGYGDCSCEGAEAEKKKEGESCGDDDECEVGLECAGGFLGFGKECTKVEEAAAEEKVIEALPIEVQAQVSMEISNLEPMLELMEQQVVEDKFVASRQELVAMSSRPDCYEEIEDVEEKAECLSIRFENVISLVQSQGIITPGKATELKEMAGISDMAEGNMPEVSHPPQASKSFFSKIGDLFRFSGNSIKVTGKITFPGYDLGIDLPEDTTPIMESPADHLLTLETQYNELTALETAICSKLPLTMLNNVRLPSCPCFTREGPNPYTCESGKCKINKDTVCPAGEFGAAAPETEETPQPCATDAECSLGETCQSGVCAIPPSPEEGMGESGESLPPATCDDPISFEIESACRGLRGTSYGFMNFTLKNSGSIGINEFKIILFESGGTLSGQYTLPFLLAAGEEYTKQVRYSADIATKYDAYNNIKAIPKMGGVLCNDKVKFALPSTTITEIPICRGMPCSTGDDCESGTACTGGVCR